MSIGARRVPGWTSSIRWKILAILFGATLLYAGIDQASLQFLWSRHFEHMEREQAEEALRRVCSVLDEEKERLAQLAEVWGGGLGADRPEEIESIGERLMPSSDVHVLYLIAQDGRVLFGRILDPGTGEPTELRQLPGQALSLYHPALVWFDEQPDHQSLAATDKGILALASRRTLVGPSSVTWILGRFLDPVFAARVGTSQGVQVNLYSDDWAEQGADPTLVEACATSESEVVRGAATAELVFVGRTLPDWEGRDSFLVEVGVPRRLVTGSRLVKSYALLSAAGTALILLLILLQLLERIVVRPLRRLTRHAVEVGKDKATAQRLDLASRDELGTLAREFARMLERLEDLRREASKASRQAGMSEVATCVLHNVGNALNGATVAAGLVRARTAGLAVEDLMLMVETLERERHDLAAFFSAGGRGRHLLAFVRELGEGMAAQRREMLAELAHLDEVIQRLVLMVAAQQSLAGGRGFPEKLSLAMQVDEVLELVRAGPGGKEIDWRREYEPVPPIVVDRHRLIEVLLVLLRNARQSVEGSPRSDRRIVLRVRRSRRGSCVEVEDNGTGIAPENLTRIFSGGFSTKPNGLGFSLHHASNAATELGGVLNGESGGAGQGACFRLELPLTDTAPSIPPAPASARDEALTAT